MEAIVKTNFNFPGQTSHYVGKVRSGLACCRCFQSDLFVMMNVSA